MSTAFIRHRDCLLHDMGRHHPESQDRLHAIEDQVIASGVIGYLQEYDAPAATRSHLARVHDEEYIDRLFACAPERGLVHLDPDTAIGPYSPAIRAGNLLFISGQVPIDPATGAVVDGDISAQTERVMRNLGALLAAAGAGFEHVARTTVFLADMNEFAAMNAVDGRYVVDPPPARATVQVARLPKDVKVEIELVAVLP